MMTNEATLPCAGGLPAGRGERRQIVLVGQAGQAGEEVAQVGERILAVALAGDDQGVEDGRALAGVGMPDKRKRPAGVPRSDLDEAIFAKAGPA